MKKSLLLFLGVVLIAGAAVLLAAVDVTGDWELTTVGRNGQERKTPITFTQKGEELMVKTTGMGGAEVTGTGTVKGNDIEWSITRKDQQGQEFKVTYKGKIDGDKMSGTYQMRDREVPWSAVRKPK